MFLHPLLLVGQYVLERRRLDSSKIEFKFYIDQLNNLFNQSQEIQSLEKKFFKDFRIQF